MEISTHHMDKNITQIVGLHRAEYEFAKQKEFYSFLSEVGVALLAIFSVFSTTTVAIYISSILALSLTILRWYFSYSSNEHRKLADRGRRLLLLSNGLGYRFSARELTDLIACFSTSKKDVEKWNVADYYSAQSTVGPERFVSMLEESVFFSKHLYKESWKQTLWWFAGAVLLSLFTLMFLPSITAQAWTQKIAQTLSVILMFLISIDVFGKVIRFFQAATDAEDIDSRLEQLMSNGLKEEDLIIVWGDYNSVIESAPLIPTFLYEKHKDRLSSLYSDRVATTS